MNTDIAYRYLPERGPRAPYVPGLPARDIAEWELLANDGWQALLDGNIESSGAIFEKVEPARKAKTVSKVEAVDVVEEPAEGTR